MGETLAYEITQAKVVSNDLQLSISSYTTEIIKGNIQNASIGTLGQPKVLSAPLNLFTKTKNTINLENKMVYSTPEPVNWSFTLNSVSQSDYGKFYNDFSNCFIFLNIYNNTSRGGVLSVKIINNPFEFLLEDRQILASILFT